MDGKFGIEPVQTLASLRVLQGRKERSRECDENSVRETPKDSDIPEFEVRVRTAQLLLETHGKRSVEFDSCFASRERRGAQHAIELFTRARDMLRKAMEFMGGEARNLSWTRF